MNKKLLKVNDFPIKTRVCPNHNNKLFGTVIGNSLTRSNNLIIEWDNGNVGSCAVSELMLASTFESEFKVYQETINTKLKEAAEALAEVARLAEEKEIDVTAYNPDGSGKMFPMLEAVSDAVDSIDRSGWSNSSRNC